MVARAARRKPRNKEKSFDKPFGVGEKVRIGDKEYTMTAPRFGMHTQVAAKIRADRRQEMTAIIRELPEGPERLEIARNFDLNVSQTDVAVYLNTVEGKMYIMWLCLNANHPELTYEDFLNFGQNDFEVLAQVHSDLEEEDHEKNS